MVEMYCTWIKPILCSNINSCELNSTMNMNENPTHRDFDPDTVPDLTGDGWPEKFSKATVRRGRPSVASPKVSTTIRLSKQK